MLEPPVLNTAMKQIYINGRFLTQKVTGVQRYAAEMVAALDKLLPGIAPDLAVSLLVPRGFLKNTLSLSNIKIVRVGRLSGHLWEQSELPLYLKTHKSDLLLCLANTGPLSIKKQVLVLHDVAFLRNPAWFSRSFAAFYRTVIPLVAKKCRRVLTDSSFSKSEILNFIPISPDKVGVIPGGVTKFAQASPQDTAYGKPGEYILAVSSLDPRKNFARLIEAFHKAAVPGMKLVIAGPRNKNFSAAGTEENAKADPAVVFTGHLSDKELASLYRGALFFVYPSLYEGFGLPPLEAMSCGCPVLVSDAASLPEVCGDAAFYVDPYSVDNIAAGITRLYKDAVLRSELVKKGKEQAGKFSWEKAARELAAVIMDETK